MEKKKFTFLQVNYWYVPPLSMLGGAKKNCTKHVLFPLEHKIYTCTQISQCEMIHIETIQMSLSMNTFERKKGNKILEVRRG